MERYWYHENFNMSPHSLKNSVNYEDKLAVYKGKLKVKFNHHFTLNVYSSFNEAVENYFEQLKKELQNFEYSSMINDVPKPCHHYYFTKSSNITENFELNIKLQFSHDRSL